MKGGVTKRIEDTLKALDQGQLRKALILTDGVPKLEQHHQWVAEAARTCLANKDDEKACDKAVGEARDHIKDTVELPEDDTSLEGLEELVDEGSVSKPEDNVPDDCQECHVADAVGQFYVIAEGCGNTEVISLIDKQVEDPDTPPTKWLKVLVGIAEQNQCGQDTYRAVLTDLTDYLEQRDSPFLKELDEGEENVQEAAVSTRAQE